MAPHSNPIDFTFRPETYAPDLCPELSLAGRVRGTWRRLAIQQSYDQGKVHELSPRIFEEQLPHAEIKAMEEGPKPTHVSGERLPCLEPDEVEVARIICWAIKKAPVIALYAKPNAERRGYSLRFVNEFGRDIVDYPSQIHRPLSLGELIRVLAQARLGRTSPRGLVWYLAIGCERRGWPADILKQGISPVS